MERIIDKITHQELIELTEKIMITTKYINARNNLTEHLNELDRCKCWLPDVEKKMEKLISDVSIDCFTDVNYQNIPLFEQIKDLVVKIKDKLKNLRDNSTMINEIANYDKRK